MKQQNVITIREKRPKAALAHLRRITGLDFHSLPESLVNPASASSSAPNKDATPTKVVTLTGDRQVS